MKYLGAIVSIFGPLAFVGYEKWKERKRAEAAEQAHFDRMRAAEIDALRAPKSKQELVALLAATIETEIQEGARVQRIQTTMENIYKALAENGAVDDRRPKAQRGGAQ